MSSFAEPLGNPKIHIVIDEVHSCYVPNSPRMPNAMKSLLSSSPSIRVTGLTATPQLEDHVEKVKKVFGKDPTIEEYTDKEQEKFKEDLLSHQPPQVSKWKVVQLVAPKREDFTAEFEALQTVIVGNTKVYPDVKIDGWMARDNILAKVISNQVHGDAFTGGLLFKSFNLKGVNVNRVKEDGSFLHAKRPESVIIVHRSPAGNEVHHALLEELVGTEGVRPFVIHDLRAGDAAAGEQALGLFTEDVKEWTGKTVIGIIDKGQTEGSNDFAKNVSTFVAVGNWTSSELKQLGGRVGRPCKLEKNDMIPVSHSLIHMTSEWANSVADIGLRRHSTRKAVVPEEMEKVMDEMDDTTEVDKLYKMIDGGKHLQTNLADLYLEMGDETSSYEGTVEEWRCYKSGFGEEGDSGEYE
jgi:hypothetical protein